jgi:MraZ protein
MAPAALLLGSIDLVLADGRFRIPDPMLGAFVGGGVMTMWLDGCLALWPRAAWDEFSTRVAGLPLTVAEHRAFARVLFASATEVPFGTGQMAIPADLRTAAGIDQDAVIVGAGGHAELWAPDRWRVASARSLDEVALPVAV